MSGSTDRLLGKNVFVRYITYSTYMNYNGKHLYKLTESLPTKTFKGTFDNHSEPMMYFDGGEEYGYMMIPRMFIIELYEEDLVKKSIHN